MSAAIRFDGVWKQFRRGENHDSLRDLVPALAARLLGRRPPVDQDKKRFWAVQDVSFDVSSGEALGIIGPNGAGKSTILKLLTRILRPTRGSASVHGRVGALIEVAAGFHPDLTGRENVYLQGAIVGMKRAEIARKFDQIVEFAGIGEFVDTPVKRFSSGMNARLGFSIAAHLDPDVLIIDEVLSVGDTAFQARCASRMREMRNQGVPFVFVSHNLPAIVESCTKAIFIDHGRLMASGTPGEVIQAYQRATTQGDQSDAAPRPESEIWIRRVELLDAGLRPTDLFRTGDRTTIRIHYDTSIPVTSPGFGVDIHRADGIYCAGIGTRIDGEEIGTVSGPGYVDLTIESLQLLSGAYALSVGIHRARGCGDYDLRMRAYPLTVTSSRADLGVIWLEHTWRHVGGSAVPAAAPVPMQEVVVS